MRFTPLRDLDTVRGGWRWAGPRPRSWPARERGVPERANDLAWARAEPARTVRWLIQHGLSLPFTRVMSDPQVSGREWVRELNRPVILASNHVSHADTQLLLYALSDDARERTVVAAAADYWYGRPWLGRVVGLWLNTFPFSRTSGPQAVLHHSSHLLRSGWNLLMYPEGTRSPDGRMREFKPGVGFLARETRSPVIPMHVRGSDRIMPKGSRIPLPSPARIRIGRPLVAEPDETTRAFAARVEGAVRRLGEGSKEAPVTGGWIERWRATAPRSGRRGGA